MEDSPAGVMGDHGITGFSESWYQRSSPVGQHYQHVLMIHPQILTSSIVYQCIDALNDGEQRMMLSSILCKHH